MPPSDETPATRDVQTALSRLRLRHVRALLAVAQAGNLRRAAEVLSLSQPAVTKTLNELEALLGQPLLVRGPRGTQLTAQGQDVARHGAASLAALRRAVEAAVGAPPEAPPLRVGVLPTLAPSLLPRVLGSFRQAWPQTLVRVVSAANAQLVRGLQAGDLDLAIGRLAEPAAMAGLSFEALAAEPLVIVARPDHPLRARRVVPATLVGGHPLVLPLPGTVIRQSADRWLTDHGVVPLHGVTETLSVSLAREWVLASGALWIAPLSAVAPDLARGLLARLRLNLDGTEEPVGLLRPVHSTPHAAAAALVDAIRRDAAAARRARRSPRTTPAEPAG